LKSGASAGKADSQSLTICGKKQQGFQGTTFVNQIARILRLNHTTLKEWVEITMQSSSEFVELPFPETLCSSIQWTVEMEKPNGTKLRMSCQGGAIQALVEMGKTFWSHGH
jgi:hypothetical protein